MRTRRAPRDGVQFFIRERILPLLSCELGQHDECVQIAVALDELDAEVRRDRKTEGVQDAPARIGEELLPEFAVYRRAGENGLERVGRAGIDDDQRSTLGRGRRGRAPTARDHV